MATALNLASFQKPAPSAPAKADWQSLDVETLGPDLKAAYYAYRKAQDAANNHRKVFEDAMRSKIELSSHLDLAFGYRWGNISVAIVPKTRPSAKAAMSLSDLMSRAS